MSIPDYQTLMLPVLSFARDKQIRVGDIEDQLANEFGLTHEERDRLLPSGRQKILHNRIHWAKFYMSKAGLIETPKRGAFIATSIGRELLARKPDRIDVTTLLEYPPFQTFYRGGGSADTADPVTEPAARTDLQATPEEQIETAVATLQSALRGDLLTRILDNSPAFFETVIIDLLVAMGYGGDRRDAAKHLGRSGDGGIDGVIDEDRLGLDRIYVQAKRYGPSNSVQRPEVQGFVGSLVGKGAHKGVFVTTSSFSQGAIDYTKHLVQRVILIDGHRLTELMIEHDVGVRTSRTVQVKRLDEDFFSDET